MRTTMPKHHPSQGSVSPQFDRPKRAAAKLPNHVAAILQLQQTIGNHAVQRMLQARAERPKARLQADDSGVDLESMGQDNTGALLQLLEEKTPMDAVHSHRRGRMAVATSAPRHVQRQPLNDAEAQVCEMPNSGQAENPVCEMPLESTASPAYSSPPTTPTVTEGNALTCEMPAVGETSVVAEAQPVCEGMSAVTPEEMVDMVISQRGFSTASPTPEGGIAPPSFEQGALGPGYQTNAVVQVLDADGNQVAFEMAQYGGGGAEHAEEQAVANLTKRLAGRRFPGGRVIAAVDQRACGRCMTLLRELAQQLGLQEVEVWGPSRVSASGRPVSPKWAARSATSVPARPSPNEPMGGTYRIEPELMQGETIKPVPEEVTPFGGLKGWGSTALGLAPIGLGLLHSWAESRRMQEQVKKEGFAPVGPSRYADENIVTRFGEWMLDPFLGGMTPAAQRFHLPTWRRHVSEKVAGRDRVTVEWEMPNPDPMLSVFPEHVNVEYQRDANGQWEVAPGQSFPKNFTPPDLNRIVDPGQSDSAVEFELACSAGQCA